MRSTDPDWFLFLLPVVALLLIGAAGAAATIVLRALDHWNHKGETPEEATADPAKAHGAPAAGDARLVAGCMAGDSPPRRHLYESRTASRT